MATGPTIEEAVNEGNEKRLLFALLDFDGVAAVPVSSRYRIDKYTAAGAGPTEVLAWTAIPAAGATISSATITITVNSVQNSFTTAGDDYEKRRVTVEALYTASTGLYQHWVEFDVVGNDSYPTVP